MRKPRYLVLAVFVLFLTAGLAVSLNQAGDQADAGEQADDHMPVTQSARTGTVVPISDQTTSTGTEYPTDLSQIRQTLSNRWAGQLPAPGWLEVRETLENLVAGPGSTTIPETQQILSNNWVRVTWLYIDSDHRVVAGYSQRSTPDGQIVSSSIMSDGSQFAPLNSEISSSFSLAIQHLDYLDRIISTGNTAELAWTKIGGRTVLVVSSSDQFTEPSTTDGIDQAATGMTGKHYYDWDSGQFLCSEDWLTLVDGTQIQANRLILELYSNVTPPEDVLDKFIPVP